MTVLAGARPAKRAAGQSRRSRVRGVTLLELLIVVTLIALVAGISYPGMAASVETMRLRSTADSVAAFLNTAIDRAERRQQLIEIWISPRDNVLIARSPDLGFSRRLDLSAPFHITAVLPAAEVNPDEPRRFLMYPGGTTPRIGVEIANENGKRRLVMVDPFTGITRAAAEAAR
jgi:prepilin-type N-terminal cleavage/methylation domain-containing protein